MIKLVILIPTYNESLSIKDLVAKLSIFREESTYKFDAVVIDDSSPDKTAELVEGLLLPWVKVMRRSRKDGLGAAYRAGFSEVLQNQNYTHVATMDADGSHRVEDLSAMISTLEGLNSSKTVVMGVRWMPGGRVTNWSRFRKLLSLSGTRYAKLALGLKLDDLTGGFRIYSSELLNSLNLKTMHASGYCFQIEMALISKEAGAEFIQIPITFVERNFGSSKMTAGIALEAFRYVTKAGFERALPKNNRR
ncbi:MAG: glycosyltransferase [Actinobacteria bacterium]|nr:glycosyltransferase [Actinomycetota bacterium]MDA2981731.1 glycosyltransferase [Actinomycetota bacterium]MDA2996629.1 glycosyltransferase [Actinomycetota bacterium]